MSSKLNLLLLTCFVLGQIGGHQAEANFIFSFFQSPASPQSGIDVPLTVQESIVLSRIITNVLAQYNALYYKNFVFFITNAELRDLLSNLIKNGQNDVLAPMIAAILEQTPPYICVKNTLLKMIVDLLNLPDKTFINKMGPIILKECFAHELGEICSPYGTTNFRLLKKRKYAELRAILVDTILKGTFCN